MNNYKKYYLAGQSAVSKASEFLRASYGDVKEMKLKSGTHYGIEDDLKTNTIIEKYLRDATPEVGIYSEEGERSLESELVWVIDPIDGTTNYRVGIPLFVSQICLLEKGEPVLAFLNSPILQMDFSAQRNHGSKLNSQTIKVSELKELNKATVSFNKGDTNENVGRLISKLGKNIRSVRSFGSMGIDLAFVASGKIDVLINSGSDLYDYAPGVILVREAGGVVVNFEGRPWSYEDKTLIAGNKELVQEVLRCL